MIAIVFGVVLALRTVGPSRLGECAGGQRRGRGVPSGPPLR